MTDDAHARDMMQLMMALRGVGVTDREVLRVLETVPRDVFVPEHLRADAYRNTALPIDCGQTITQPMLVG
ncbi:MAG: protein-L-isoaspartate O-methyltransferase, partial [Pseudomonadota bacterium]